MDVVVERPGAFDVHKASVTACARVPAERGRRDEHIAQFSTTVQGLLGAVRLAGRASRHAGRDGSDGRVLEAGLGGTARSTDRTGELGEDRQIGSGSMRSRDQTSNGRAAQVGPSGNNAPMLRLIGLVVMVGLADSLNPSTIAPALYLGSGEKALSRVAEFTLAVFSVSLLAGVIVALGPGQLLSSLISHTDAAVRYVAELAAGTVLVAAATFLWLRRGRLAERGLPDPNPRRQSTLLLGATIAVVELPTAFPYFAAIAAIAGSGIAIGPQLLLLALFNVCFALPLVAIIATLLVAGDRAQGILATGRNALEQRWPAVLAALLMFAGLFAIFLGASGLVGSGHGHVARSVRGARRSISP